MEIGPILNELKKDPIYMEAVKNGIDVEKTVSENAGKWKKFQLKTATTFAKSEITKKIQSKNDSSVSGIMVGQYDSFGRKFPIAFAILDKDGNHQRVVSYDGNKLPVIGRVDLKTRYNSNFDNFAVTDVVKIEPMDELEVLKKIMRVSKSVDELDFNSLEKKQVIVVRGPIRWVNPATKWVDKQPSGEEEVYLSTDDTEKRYTPVIDIVVGEQGEKNSVTVQLGRLHYAHPVYHIEDLNDICQFAHDSTPDPVEQAKTVKGGISGRNVVAVGEVVSLKPASDEGKSNYINIRCFAIFEYMSDNIGASPSEKTSTLSSFEPSPKEKVQIGSPKEEKPVEQPVVISTPKSVTPVETSTSKESYVDDLAKKIERIAGVLGRGKGTFGVAEIRTLMKVPPDYPDAIIEEAIRKAVLG